MSDRSEFHSLHRLWFDAFAPEPPRGPAGPAPWLLATLLAALFLLAALAASARAQGCLPARADAAHAQACASAADLDGALREGGDWIACVRGLLHPREYRSWSPLGSWGGEPWGLDGPEAAAALPLRDRAGCLAWRAGCWAALHAVEGLIRAEPAARRDDARRAAGVEGALPG